jgi:diguanylate cyclase (GGDEF)-like protein/PAS domain S-box-containing protein
MFTRIKERAGNVSLRRRAFRKSDGSFRTLTDSISSAIFISQEKRLRYVNHAAETITGYSRKELLTMNFGDLVHPDCQTRVISRGGVRPEGIGVAPQHEVKIVTKQGQERWLDITVTTMPFEGAVAKLVSAFDLTERKHAEKQEHLLAITDPLTGLGNYRQLIDTFHAEIERSGRTERPFAVLLLDLDKLKTINDRYGHVVGSRALCRLGNVLRVYCRSIDTAARYGGDEFAIILPETSAASAELVASRIRERLAMDTQQPPLSACTGVAAYPQGGKTVEALLREADRKLYAMKRGSGKALGSETTAQAGKQ